MEGLAIAAILLLLACCFVLPAIAVYRTRNLKDLELRIAGLETALLRLIREREAESRQAAAPSLASLSDAVPEPSAAPSVDASEETPAPVLPARSETGPQPHLVPSSTPAHAGTQSLEAIIGQKWLGWVAVALIFFATGFFLKYAFENRWIGEVGRVAIGLISGLALIWAGYERHSRAWRYLSQVLTSGGVGLLYLSVYGAFGYYSLIDQQTAFLFLVAIVAGAHWLAVLYDARVIAVMGLAGGLLAPVLLSTGTDRYAVLFGYIAVLDLGVVALLIWRRWSWIRVLAFTGTQALFWSWYQQYYSPEKRTAALLLQAAVFLLFVFADLVQLARKRAAGGEEFALLILNPFVFYSACYVMFERDYRNWMGPLAVAMASTYGLLATAAAGIYFAEKRVRLIMLGTAVAFLTAAVPIQLESHWITISWAAEAAALAWAGLQTATPLLRRFSTAIFAAAVLRYLFVDVPWDARLPFTPIWNTTFLVTAVVTACLSIAAWLYWRTNRRAAMFTAAIAGGVLWIGSSVETFNYFGAQANAAMNNAGAGPAAARQLRWAAQMALSLLWSVYAAVLAALGFRFGQKTLRSAGLVLFGITLVKVVLVDISELRQLYRIVALLALGLLLLRVAWAYQAALRRGSDAPVSK